MASFLDDLGITSLTGDIPDVEPTFNLGAPSSNIAGSVFNLPSSSYYDWKAPDIPETNVGLLDKVKNLGGAASALEPFGAAAKYGYDAWNKLQHEKQLGDYNKAYATWAKAQNDYIAQKREWETKYLGQFDTAMGEFGAANEEFQGQLGAAQEKVGAVFEEFMKASQPLLAQSQEMLVPAVEALARGEEPAVWKPLFDQVRQRATQASIQSLMSGGMSYEAALAATQPMVEQQIATMKNQLATTASTQGLAIGSQGLTALSGAGQLTQILGTLAQMGLGPATTEFQALANVIRSLGGNDQMIPPAKPTV